MKNTLTRSIFCGLLAFVILSGSPVTAQQSAVAFNNTTLNGAITATDSTLVLTSATAIAGSSFGAPAAGQCLYIASPNLGEFMTITAMSSTTATVQRRNNPQAHPTLARIFTGNCNLFKTADPPPGSCTASASPLPWINVNNGNIARCMGTTGWTMTNATALTYSSVAPGLPW